MIFIIGVSCSFNVKSNQVNHYSNNFVVKNSKDSAKASRIKANRSMRRDALFNVNKTDKVYYSGKAIVLTYHHISDTTYGDITITPERFENDINMLKDKGFNVISLRSMIDAMSGNGKMPDNAVVITFDDGIESFYKYAYPVLQRYKMPAVNFLITCRDESYKPSDKDNNSLSPDEISEMYSSGLIDFESHTHNSHEKVYINAELKMGPKLTNKIYDKDTRSFETDEEYAKRVTDDLTRSSELINKYTGHYSDVLCFPYGVYNKKVIEIAKKCGFQYFVTTIEGYNKESSGKDKILRIRSGDAKLDTEKLFTNIIDTANNKKVH